MNELNQVLSVNVDSIIPNKYQPRKVFNEESLKELATSIKEYGILNPILVRKSSDKYEIIAGERRYRAAKLAGLTEVPIIIKDISDSKMAEMALIENLQRENISPIEEAKAYEEILNLSSITEQKLSEMLGKSQSAISNKLRLLKLPENIQDALSKKKISERHARSLLTVVDENKQTELLNRIINEKLTVKELENIINEKTITDDEIQAAINDIMKSLSESEKKEEKESDNMNDGNFFPNMNQNIPQGGQPTTLNSMNMQTMGGAPMPSMQPLPQEAAPVMAPQPEMVQPTPIMAAPQEPAAPQAEANPIPDFSAPITPVEETPAPAAPMQDAPLFGGNMMETPSVQPLPQEQTPVMVPQPEMVQPTPIMEAPQEPAMPQVEANPIPDFSAPITPVEETPAPAAPVQDAPLFNNEANVAAPAADPVPLNEPVYEVPVNVSPVIEVPNNSQDKLNKVQELLSSNGIEYKSYGNENGHCIIIEL